MPPKLRIQPLSDLHLEMHEGYAIAKTDADMIALAGDIHTGTQGITWAAGESQRLGKPIVYVAGNHEYYGHDFCRLTDQLREEALRTGIFFLSDDFVDMGGCRILGCTLWTDYLAWKSAWDIQDTMLACERALADHRLIHMGEKLFMPEDARLANRKSTQWLQTMIANNEGGIPSIVVTHHSPSLRCAHPNFDLSPTTAAYCSDLEHLISGADLWIYGHTHSCFDSLVAGTRVVSNQGGYPFERTFGFDPSKVIDVVANGGMPGKGECT